MAQHRGHLVETIELTDETLMQRFQHGDQEAFKELYQRYRMPIFSFVARQYTTTDTLQIVVYADACEHASNQDGFEWIPGDINHDCIVDELDQAIMLERWLESNYSTE